MVSVIRLLKDMIIEVVELHEALTDERVISDIHDAVLKARMIIRDNHREHVKKRRKWRELFKSRKG